MADAITGVHKTAILCLALGDKFTSELFKNMDRNEIAKISQAMLELDIVPSDVVEAVLRDFYRDLLRNLESISGGQDAVKRVVLGSLDSDTAKYIMDSLNMEYGPTPFRELANVSPRLLGQILRNEHPQTLALILGHLGSDHAAELLGNLPTGVRSEILIRLAKLEAVPEEMLVEVDRVLQSQLIAMGGKEGKKVGGVAAVAEILNSVDRASEEEILADIEEESAPMAEEIRNLMFVFDDVKELDDRAVREILKEISNEDLTVALKAASEELRDKFFKNLSSRASTMIKEDLEVMGPVKLSDVEAAQQNIVKVVRRLESEGRVSIGRGGSDVFV